MPCPDPKRWRLHTETMGRSLAAGSTLACLQLERNFPGGPVDKTVLPMHTLQPSPSATTTEHACCNWRSSPTAMKTQRSQEKKKVLKSSCPWKQLSADDRWKLVHKYPDSPFPQLIWLWGIFFFFFKDTLAIPCIWNLNVHFQMMGVSKKPYKEN